MISKCREYSLPLIAGVVIAIVWANLSPESYAAFVYTPIAGDHIDFHFLINDIFMAFFFGIAGIEIVHSLSPGGALNPIQKAVTPLMATAGGVLGPIALFFLLNTLIGAPEYANGWGVCTATDIALAWLLARLVFGASHPAVSFLLLLAVADDGIGLVIIAVFYPDPHNPTEPLWLILVLVGMLVAYLLKKKRVASWIPYIFGAGLISWIGMFNAHLHPALALVFIVGFLPQVDYKCGPGQPQNHQNMTLNICERQVSPFVDFGLILFGISNAGVQFAEMSVLTWIICISLIVGKTVGISLFTWVATLLKFKLPDGMRAKDVLVAGAVGGMGLTVALFVAGAAYTDLSVQGAAKMGALFTAVVFLIAPVLGKVLRVQKITGCEKPAVAGSEGYGKDTPSEWYEGKPDAVIAGETGECAESVTVSGRESGLSAKVERDMENGKREGGKRVSIEAELGEEPLPGGKV